MPKYLSAAWHDMAKALSQRFPAHEGVSARLLFVVTGGPDGDCKYHQIIEDGRVIEQALGDCADPKVTMTVSWDDSVKMQSGELDANVAFMQGRMKVAGDMGTLMKLMPLTMHPDYRAMQAELRAQTEY